MTPPNDPIVPIVPYEELSPAFQGRSRQATARLGVTVNSVHACAHAEELGGAARDFLSSAMTIDAGGIAPAIHTEFIEQFTPQERVEVAIVATAMGMLNKINDALRVPLESEFEALVT